MNKILFTTRLNQATNTKGESITVIMDAVDTEGNKVLTQQQTVAYNYALDGYDNHLKAIYEVVDDVPLLNKIKDLKRGYKFEELSGYREKDFNFFLA